MESGGYANYEIAFDVNERVAWNGNCDFPTTGESHSIFLGIDQHARQLTISTDVSRFL